MPVHVLTRAYMPLWEQSLVLQTWKLKERNELIKADKAAGWILNPLWCRVTRSRNHSPRFGAHTHTHTYRGGWCTLAWGPGQGNDRKKGKKKGNMAVSQTGVQRRGKKTETNWNTDEVPLANTLANAVTQNALSEWHITIKMLNLSVTSLLLSPGLLLPILLWDQRHGAGKRGNNLSFFGFF